MSTSRVFDQLFQIALRRKGIGLIAPLSVWDDFNYSLWCMLKFLCIKDLCKVVRQQHSLVAGGESRRMQQ